jgi:hypothetical protein
VNDLALFLDEKLQPLLAEVRAARADGRVSLAEAWRLLCSAAQLAVDLAQAYGDVRALPGAEKKAAVLSALGLLIDHVWPLLTFPGWLSALRLIPLRMFKQALLYAIDPVIELAVRALPGRAK